MDIFKPAQVLMLVGLSIMAGAAILGFSKKTGKLADSKIVAKGRQAIQVMQSKKEELIDRIDQESDDSFPASDPPSWSGSIAGGNRL